MSDDDTRRVYDQYGEEGLQKHGSHGDSDVFSRYSNIMFLFILPATIATTTTTTHNKSSVKDDIWLCHKNSSYKAQNRAMMQF